MVWAQYKKVYGTSLEVKVLDVAAETLLHYLWNSPLHRRRMVPGRRRNMLYDSREESSYVVFRRPSCKCDTALFLCYSDELFCSNFWTRRNTMSNELSGKGRSSASPCFHSIPSVTPARAASSFARSKSSGVRSIPITFPPALHAVMAVMPVPHATSSTCSPRLTLAARTK